MIKGIHHIALAVADLEAAARFHGQAAGLREAQQPVLHLPLPAGTTQARMLAGPNCSLRLLQLATPAPAGAERPVCEAGITHFCLQSVDAADLHARFGAAGAGFHSGPIDLGTGYLYCYSRDTESNVIELEGVAPVWDDLQPWFAHVAISSAALGSLCRFYEGVFGSSATRSGRLANNRRLDRVAKLPNVALEAAWIPASNIQVELMQYFEPATVAPGAPLSHDAPGYRYIALEVEDVDAELARLLTLGAALPAGAPQLPAGAGRQHAFCADPEGNLLLLMSIASDQASDAIDALPDPSIVARLSALGSAANKKETP